MKTTFMIEAKWAVGAMMIFYAIRIITDNVMMGWAAFLIVCGLSSIVRAWVDFFYHNRST